MILAALNGHTLRYGKKPAVMVKTCAINKKKKRKERKRAKSKTYKIFSAPHN